MDFVKVARVDDIPARDIRSFAVLASRIGVYRTPDGALRAVEVRCKHQGADLTGGGFDGRHLTCPRHGWRYDLRSGECLNAHSPPLRPHAVREEGGWVWVSTRPEEPQAPEGPDDDGFPTIQWK
jgi:nitrite reductase/ring-hydroxylating ferredoxin subunit